MSEIDRDSYPRTLQLEIERLKARQTADHVILQGAKAAMIEAKQEIERLTKFYQHYEPEWYMRGLHIEALEKLVVEHAREPALAREAVAKLYEPHE